MSREDELEQLASKEPRYPISVAAILAGTTTHTLTRWVRGASGTEKRAAEEPVIHLDAPDLEPTSLSFFNVVEAGFLAAYRSKQLSIQRIRKAIRFIEDTSGDERPLLGEKFKTVGKDILYPYVMDHGETRFLNVTTDGQVEWPEAVAEYFDSIRYDEHGPILMWLNARRSVGINPRVGFGYPILVSRGLRTDVIAERFEAGEDSSEIAEDFSITVDDVNEALRWELDALRRRAA